MEIVVGRLIRKSIDILRESGVLAVYSNVPWNRPRWRRKGVLARRRLPGGNQVPSVRGNRPLRASKMQ